MGKNYEYYEITHPITGNIMWKIDDICLPLGGVDSLVEKFIKEHLNEDYSLSICDNLTQNKIYIDCDTINMPKIVKYIYHIEKGSPITFIEADRLTKSYVVYMPMFRGRISFGRYKDENGKLVRQI